MSADLLEAFGNPKASPFPSSPSGAAPSYGTVRSVAEQQLSLSGHPGVDAEASLSSEDARHSLWQTDEGGGEVLFDAATAEEEDFGDFELPAHSEVTSKVDTGLLALEDMHIDTIARQQSKLVINPNEIKQSSTSLIDVGSVTTSVAIPDQGEQHDDETIDEWGTFEDANLERPKISANVVSPHAAKSTQSDGEEEDWGKFEDGPASLNTIHRPTTNTASPEQKTERPDFASINSSKPHERPTNIPPPFTILQLLPAVYQNLAHQSKSKSTSDLPSTKSLAQIILQTYRVTARVISGRNHRWTRDTHLSQSMRISEAGGMKKSGMKLTALDKGESIKEDQQAIEVVNAWSNHAHLLNSCMAKAKVQKPPMSLSHNSSMNVRAVNGTGVLTAKEICAICGLKRNERVLGIDVKVEDSFGEFWVEFWGHKDCYEFWYRFERLLDRR